MKLQSLTLSNFSSHAATTVNFTAPVTLIVAPLNAGKSSICQALEYALTAELERYRKKNAPFTDLIHDRGLTDQSRFVVELKTAEGTIKRGKGMTGPAFTSWDGAIENAEGLAYGSWKTSKDILSALLATGDFFDKESKEQKELILRLLGAKVTTESVQKAFPGDQKAFSLMAIREFDSIQSLDNAYDEAYKLRTTINRDLKVLQPAAPPEGKEPPVDGIRKRIQELEGERTVKLRELGAARAAIGRPSIKPTLERQLKELQEWLDKHAHPQDFDAMTKELALANAAQIQIQVQLDEQRKLLVAAQAESLLHQKNHDILIKFNGKCVVGAHECPATREQMGKAKEEEQLLAKQAAVKAEKLQADVVLLERLSRDRSAIAAIEGRIATASLDVKEYDRKEKQEEELEKQISEFKDEPQGDPEAIKALELAVAELDSRLAKGRQTLEGANSWLMRKKAVDEVAAKRANLERQSTMVEALVEFFGPKGIKVKLIEEKTAAFSEMVNKGAATFGFGFQFTAEPNWTLSAKWPNADQWKPVDRLSRSERYRLGVALQVAIAKTTGVNLLVADNAELLPPAEFGQLMKLISGAGVQAIVVKTLTGKTEVEFKKAPPKIPGCQVLWVNNKNGVSEVEVLS